MKIKPVGRGRPMQKPASPLATKVRRLMREQGIASLNDLHARCAKHGQIARSTLFLALKNGSISDEHRALLAKALRAREASLQTDRSAQDIPLLGRVAAGLGSLANQEFDGFVELKEYVGAGARSYALRVTGDSMMNAGILDRDLVVIREQPKVENGEIGVVIIGDEATCKRIYDDGPQLRLVPENPAYETRFVDKAPDVLIAGKVIGVIRKC